MFEVAGISGGLRGKCPVECAVPVTDFEIRVYPKSKTDKGEYIYGDVCFGPEQGFYAITDASVTESGFPRLEASDCEFSRLEALANIAETVQRAHESKLDKLLRACMSTDEIEILVPVQCFYKKLPTYHRRGVKLHFSPDGGQLALTWKAVDSSGKRTCLRLQCKRYFLNGRPC